MTGIIQAPRTLFIILYFVFITISGDVKISANVTKNDSWNPISKSISGLYASIRNPTKNSKPIVGAVLSKSLPISISVSIKNARIIGGPKPVIQV